LTNTTNKLYSEFRDWCTRNEIKNPTSIKIFHKDIEDAYHFERRRVRNVETGNKYKWKFVTKLD